ncbi:MAG: adenylyl-sulfate kinase [Tumebacillaceae bacterium]
MEKTATNVVWHQAAITKEDRQRLNGHKSCAVWLTGLSGAGKSTIVHELDRELHARGIRSFVLDGDNVRHGLNKNLGFSPEDRTENLRRVGEVAKLFVEAGVFALVALISPYESDRNMVRGLFPEGEFAEVYVRCSVDECGRRDPKGLYKKALAGEISNFTGVSAPYEAPSQPEIVLDTEFLTVEEAVAHVLDYLTVHGYLGER